MPAGDWNLQPVRAAYAPTPHSRPPGDWEDEEEDEGEDEDELGQDEEEMGEEDEEEDQEDEEDEEEEEARLANSVSAIVQRLRSVLAANHSRVIDLFRQWDRNGDGTCTKVEVRRALAVLGQDVPMAEVDVLFRSLDADASTRSQATAVLKGQAREET